MRLARLLPIVLALGVAAGLGGCGSSSEESTPSQPPQATTSTTPPGAVAKSCDTYAVDAEGLRVTGVSCDAGRKVMYGWQRAKSCSGPAGASRRACVVRGYQCLGATTDRGSAVSCATEGRAISFVVRPPR